MTKQIIILLLLVSLFFNMNSYGQQLPSFSQYMQNSYLFNPAVAGSKAETNISLTIRQQWLGIEGSPSTQVAEIHGKWGEKKGLGAMFFNDKAGPFSKTGLQVSYAQHLQITKQAKLALGFSGMFYQHKLDRNSIVFDDPNDYVIMGDKQRTLVPDMTFGIYYYKKKFYAGASIPQLLQKKHSFSSDLDSANQSMLSRHYFFHSGYTFTVNDQLNISPSVLVRTVLNSPTQVDLSLKATYKKFIWIGGSFRFKEAVIMMVGLTKEKFTIGYSFDATTSSIKNYSTGSHEIYLALKIPN